MPNFIKVFPFFVVVYICTAGFAMADDLTDSLKLKMKYLSQSQAVISKNIANSNTPGYKAREVSKPYYASTGLHMVTTSPVHIGGADRNNKFQVVRQKDAYETAPNGNNVSIEEQMVKMSANSSEHSATTNLLHKINTMVGLATGAR